MPVYRAQEASAPPGLVLGRLPTKRLPKDVPFLVDNVWEWVRARAYPAYPSRRYAVFAAASVAAARLWATNAAHVYEVILPAGQRVAQHRLQEAIARHADLEKVQRMVSSVLQRSGWADRPLADRLPQACLFAPGLDAAEVEAILSAWPEIGALRDELLERLTFWREVNLIPAAEARPELGEVFFEPGESGYGLEPTA